MKEQEENSQQNNNSKNVSADKKPINPFANHQSGEKDIAASREEIEKEQQFKEAQSERD